MKKVLLGLLSVFAIVAIAACGRDTDPEPIEVESVTLSETALEMEIGEAVTVTATVEPSDAENTEVRWTTSNSQVAVVSEGEIQALRAGTATITATSRADSDISASLTVTVLAEAKTVEEVLDADVDDEVNVIGVVTAKTNHLTFFIEDETGALAVYDNDGDFIDDLSVGDEVRIFGQRDAFNGLQQVSNPTRVDEISTGNDLPATVDIDDVDIEDNDAMMPFQGHRVNLTGFLIDSISTDTHDNIMIDLFSPFTEQEINIRYDSRLGHDTDAAALLEFEEGDLVDINGMILGWFHNPQLLFTSIDEVVESTRSLDLALEVDDIDEELTVGIHTEYQIEWTVQPAAWADQDVTFVSSDADVATVDAEGLITGIKSGSAEITITVDEDPTIEFVFTVVVPVEAINTNIPTGVDPTDDEETANVLTLYNTQEFGFIWEIGDPDDFDQDITLSIDDTDYVTIDEYVFTADTNNTGYTKVTVTWDYDDASVFEFYVVVNTPQPSFGLPPFQQIANDNTTFNVFDDVTAVDQHAGDITDRIELVDIRNEADEVLASFPHEQPGIYTITFKVENDYDVEIVGSRQVQVMEEGEEAINYPTGVFNFRFADPDTRHTLFAAAERYLMQTQYGGVPVYMNAGYAMYSPRIVFPVDEYVPVMGWGLGSAEMDADDSTVDMEDGSPGNVGEFTYRTAVTSNPDTFDQWNYTDAVTADIATLYLDSLYYFDFNADLTGYEVLPSMATDMPTPFDAAGVALIDEHGDPTSDGQEIIDEWGRILAKTWQVEIQDDLEWFFHPNTPNKDDYDTDITAYDFINTFKLALEENWFRAISGGGDFTSAPQEIVGAQAFALEDGDWEDVGLRAVDEYTLEFEFVENMDEWSVIYWLSSFVMTPIHLELYADVGDLYGTSEVTTAYHGPFYIDYYEPDQIVRLAENPNFHDSERFFYTGYTWRVIEDVEIRFEEFLAGRLDATAVPSARFEDYQDDDRIKFIPGATTFRMSINSLGSVDAQLDQFPGSSFVPEPLLGWYLEDGTTMRNAIFFALNRQQISDEVMITNDAQMFYFSEAYLVAPETGISFREWDYQQGIEHAMIQAGVDLENETEVANWMANDFEEDYPYTVVGLGFSPSTYGYNPDLARQIFRNILEEMVDEGYYEAGDRIVLDLGIQSGSEALMAYAEYVKSEFERYFFHEELNIGVTVDITPTVFPDNYFLRHLIGVGDLNMGGISGSTLDAASFLDVFADDNRGGFTLDWGIDTSTANIPVTYVNLDGDEVTEMWSFNALVRALNGTAYVLGGEESTKDIVAPDAE